MAMSSRQTQTVLTAGELNRRWDRWQMNV